MSYKLVIAEKPSVAQSIAKVIGADKREDGYLEGNGYIVSWCVGHLVELASPESYDEKYEKWRYEDLPILPSEWNYQIAEATRKQFGILKKLIEREDVTGLVEATDAGRDSKQLINLGINFSAWFLGSRRFFKGSPDMSIHGHLVCDCLYKDFSVQIRRYPNIKISLSEQAS